MLRAFLLLVLFTSTIIAGFYIFRDKKPDEEIFTSQDESENSSIKDNFTDNPSSYPYPGNQVLSIEPKKIVTNDNPVNEKQQSTKQKKIKKVDTNDNPINEIEQKAKQNDIPTIIVLLSLFISLICIIITFLVYRWKRILINGTPNALVPEEWKKSLDDYKNSINSLVHAIVPMSKNIESQKEISMSMQKKLDEKDALINRFRKGYDNEITKKFAYRLLKLKNIIEELILEPNLKNEDMKNLNESLSDILDENDIESFSPNLGEDYRKLGDLVSDKVDFQPTNNENDNFKITEILKKGYRFKGGNNEIILPAEVKINKFN